MHEHEYGGRRRSVQDLDWHEGERLSAEQRALHPDLDRLKRWGEKRPALYSGVWMDEEPFLERSGPVGIVLGVTGDEEAVRGQVVPLMENPDRLSVERKPYSARALRQIQDRIVRKYLRTADSALRGVGADARAGVVSVMLRGPDDKLQQQILAEFGRDIISFEYGGLV